jgi:hypothetical protein
VSILVRDRARARRKDAWRASEAGRACDELKVRSPRAMTYLLVHYKQEREARVEELERQLKNVAESALSTPAHQQLLN